MGYEAQTWRGLRLALASAMGDGEVHMVGMHFGSMEQFLQSHRQFLEAKVEQIKANRQYIREFLGSSLSLQNLESMFPSSLDQKLEIKKIIGAMMKVATTVEEPSSPRPLHWAPRAKRKDLV